MSLAFAVDMVGVLAAIALFAVLWWRPTTLIGIALVVVLLAVAVIVNWRQISEYRLRHLSAIATTAAPSIRPHAGT